MLILDLVTRGLEMKRIKREMSFVKHTRPPHGDTWSSLPMEILTHIFSHVINFDKGVRFLCRCVQVCQTWCSVASQSISWQGIADLSFIGEKKIASDNLLEKLSSTKLNEIKGLNLCGWIHLTKVGMSSVAEHCRKLEFLNISHCQKNISKITADNIVELAENTNLRDVNFSNLRICTGHYAMAIVRFIKIRGQYLTHVNLSDNVSLGSVVMTSICENCPSLKVLNLSNTSVRSICFLSLQRSCNKLEELYLANLALEIKALNNNNNNSDKIPNPGFPHMKILSVAKSHAVSWFTDSLIQTILKTSHGLRTLDIRGNRSITDEGLEIPSTNVQRLFISRTNISIKSIEVICHKWNHVLWDLDLSWSDAYGTQFDVLIDHLIASNEPCTKLRNLNLAGTAVTDIGVKSILLTCLSLECLDLTSCRGVARGNKRFHDGVEAIESLRCSYNINFVIDDDGVLGSK